MTRASVDSLKWSPCRLWTALSGDPKWSIWRFSEQSTTYADSVKWSPQENINKNNLLLIDLRRGALPGHRSKRRISSGPHHENHRIIAKS